MHRETQVKAIMRHCLPPVKWLLSKCWQGKKEIPCTMLEVVSINLSTLEKQPECYSEIKNRVAIQYSDSTPMFIHKGNEVSTSERHLYSVFMAAVFTIAKK